MNCRLSVQLSNCPTFPTVHLSNSSNYSNYSTSSNCPTIQLFHLFQLFQLFQLFHFPLFTSKILRFTQDDIVSKSVILKALATEESFPGRTESSIPCIPTIQLFHLFQLSNYSTSSNCPTIQLFHLFQLFQLFRFPLSQFSQYHRPKLRYTAGTYRHYQITGSCIFCDILSNIFKTFYISSIIADLINFPS